MLSRSILLVLLIISIITFSGSVSAELVYIDKGIIYEDVGDQYWFQDLSFFTNKNYYEQIETIATLSGNWRMANKEDIDNLWVYDEIEIGNVFTPSYIMKSPYESVVRTGWRGRTNQIMEFLMQRQIYQK